MNHAARNRASRRILHLHLEPWRTWLVAGVLGLWAVLLIGRALYLQGLQHNFLQDKGDEIAARRLTIPAYRGMILDRDGRPLAISRPVETLWGWPKKIDRYDAHQLARLAGALGVPVAELRRRIATPGDGILSLDRDLDPKQAARITELNLPGLQLQREFRRFYPDGSVAAHVVGFTNVDDVGQDGIELAYNDWLEGRPGSRHVIRDRRGRIVAELSPERDARQGGNLTLSIDLKIQYIAHKALKEAFEASHAEDAGIVVLDARTGEILAMSSMPDYDPNHRANLTPRLVRNRVLTDSYEPGSVMKPFTVADVMEHGLVTPDTVIDTAPGYAVGGKVIRDDEDFPEQTVTQILQRSSNIGAVHLAMMLTPQQFIDNFRSVGFGAYPDTGFPGESNGYLHPWRTLKPVDQATEAYGYGVSVTLMQLARAYMAFANNGVIMPLTFLKRDPADPVQGVRVYPAPIAAAVRRMLMTVTQDGGTAVRADIPGYTVAGKTGTAHKWVGNRYAQNQYYATFVGMAPATRPRFIVAVMFNDPKGPNYYGGLVAAPVFAKVMGTALREFNVPPDEPMPPPAVLTERAAPREPA